MSIPSEMGHLAMPINFLAQRKNQMAQTSFEHGITLGPEYYTLCRCATLAGRSICVCVCVEYLFMHEGELVDGELITGGHFTRRGFGWRRRCADNFHIL